ncbi:MAG: hypothetical protein EKK48_22430 [Candidatus Melainabacteria bacterium]|nr:MAG: hypothetical protein EKK48_22430 [Candidatus Melainabacteria bacterium]
MGQCERERQQEREREQARVQKARTARKIGLSKLKERPEKLKILLAALILVVAFSINFYWFTRSSLPAPIDYNAVYDALHARD